MSTFSIKDIENFTGVKSHTLRIWEQRYKFFTPKRTQTNIRYYDDEDLKKLLNISILNNNGVKISKIASMSEDEIRSKVLELSQLKPDHENQIKALSSSMLNMDEAGFEKVMNNCILQLGLEVTMQKIVIPFMQQVGVLWAAGSIHVAHEHFMTHLIRQKLIVGIDSVVQRINPDSKKFLLFLHETESHELGLLFANYLLRSRGHQVIYLGQNLPLNDLESVFDFHKPDFLFSFFSISLSNEHAQDLVNYLGEKWPNATILLTGPQIVNKKLRLKPNTHIIQHIDAFINYINQLEHKGTKTEKNNSRL